MIVPPSFISCVKANELIKKRCTIWIVAMSVEKAREEKSASDVLVGILRCISSRFIRITTQ